MAPGDDKKQEQPDAGAEAPEAPEQLGALQGNVEKTPLQTAIDNSLQRFVNLIKEHDDFDFAGEHDSADELEQNSAFNTIINSLKTFFEENAKKTADAPLQYFSTWMNKSCEFLTNEIEDYDDSSGAMGIVEAEAAIKALQDQNAIASRTEVPGIGPFKEWFEATHPDEYQNWLTEKEQKQEVSKSLSSKKEDLAKRANDLEQKLLQMASTAEIEKNKKELTDLKIKIPDAPDLATAAAYETILVALEGSAVAYEKQAAEKAKKEAEQATEQEKQKQEQEAKEAAQRAKEEETLLESEEEREAPIVDKLLNFTNRLPENSKLKPILTIIAAFLTSIGVGMAKWPWIGEKLRGTFISNKLLAEKGDETAKLALKTEHLFRKYGLPRALANELGGVATKEAVKVLRQKAAEIKPEDISDEVERKTAEAEKMKFTNLADALTQRNGDKSDQSLFEFAASKEWETPAVAVAPQAPAPAAAPQQPTVAPAVVPAAAPAAAPTPLSGAAKPAENPETKLIQATNEELKKYENRTIDLTQETFSFRLPYISQNGGIEYANCSIKENNITIGGHKYRLELPVGANLQKITIQGPFQTGSAELMAGKFMMSDSKEIPLKTLLANFEALQKEPKDRTIAIGGKSATFKYLA
ncbi:hypothetical protein HZC21_03350 [Candidatus Peregrinibacteria bacterium]|nr:hypothetical protein [Candidatus Peregrinibacteria bacterium]